MPRKMTKGRVTFSVGITLIKADDVKKYLKLRKAGYRPIDMFREGMNISIEGNEQLAKGNHA